jgi:hypothetical protein
MRACHRRAIPNRKLDTPANRVANTSCRQGAMPNHAAMRLAEVGQNACRAFLHPLKLTVAYFGDALCAATLLVAGLELHSLLGGPSWSMAVFALPVLIYLHYRLELAFDSRSFLLPCPSSFPSYWVS